MKQLKPVNVGIVGLGTVGSGTFNVLRRNAEDIARRAGREIVVTHVGARRDHPDSDTSSVQVSRDIFDVINDSKIDIVVELIGGTGVARELVLKAIENGKHVVTANKALIAEYGNEIFSAAQEKGVNVAFEAAVAGGVPIIKAIREGLSANRIDWVAGIINGTGNFILTEMGKGRDFDEVLKQAQVLGYAEADPTFDVEGVDAAHKLTILASIAFGIPLQFPKVYMEGISKITQDDVAYADELGYHIKHLGVTRKAESGVELRVHPTLIPKSRLIASVHGVMNAIMVQSDAVGPTLYYGSGAGSEPTASAVVADVVDVARALTTDPNNRVPHLAFQADQLSDLPILPIQDVETGYYLRFQAKDEPGVMAKLATALSESDINIEAIIQKNQPNESDPVPVIMLAHKVVESKMDAALEKIRALDVLVEDVIRIRLETLDS